MSNFKVTWVSDRKRHPERYKSPYDSWLIEQKQKFLDSLVYTGGTGF